MLLVHLALRSGNAKTGPIPVSTTAAKTCPPACPFNHRNAGGCYASHGPLSLHWRAVSEGQRGDDWATFCRKVAELPAGQLWRHNQAGDLPGHGNVIDARALAALVKANAGRRGFTYTHKPVEGSGKTARANREAIKAANAGGFTVNLSANSPAHADALAETGVGPVVTVLPATVDGAKTPTLATPAGRKVAVCPATYREGVSCATCGLCQRRDRKVIVGFPAHGTGKRQVSAIAAA